MYNLSSNGLNSRTHPNDPPASSSNPEGSTGGLANFQFKKIGQPPALLQRMSESGPDIDISQNYSEASPSPDLEDELLVSDSSPETIHTGQPSLIARIAMSEPTNTAIDDMDVEESILYHPDFPTTVTPSRNNDRGLIGSTASGGLQPIFSKVSPSSEPTNVKNKALYALQAKVNTNASTLASSSSTNSEPAIGPSDIRQQPNDMAASTSKNSSLNSSVKSPLSIQHSPTLSQQPVPTNGTQSRGAAFSTENSGLPSHRDLQRQLSFALSNVHPINTANIMHLSQSNQEQFAEIISTFRKAYEQAQPIVASINQYFEVMQQCMQDFDTLQTRVNMLSDAAGRLDLGQNREWIDKAKAILSQMDQRIRIDEQEARDAEIRREKELEVAEGRTRARSMETAPVASNMSGAPPNSSFGGSSHIGVNNTHRPESNPPLPSVEDEANAARQAWSKVREESATRRKSDEEEIERRRAAEDALEAQLARLKAENAEVEERARIQREEDARLEAQKEEETKHKEQLARQRADQELALKRADEERALQAARERLADEKEKKENERKALLQKKLAAEREERDRRALEEEERRRREEEWKRKEEEQKRKEEEQKRKEEEQKRKDEEKKRREEEEAEQKRVDEEKRRQQDLRRQYIAAQKQKTVLENAKRAQATRAQTQPTQSPQESISHSHVSNQPLGPASGTEASISNIASALRNLAPRIATATVGPDSSRKGVPENHRTGVPADRASLPTPSSSARVSPIAPTVTRPQSNFAFTGSQAGAEYSRPTKHLSTSLPSPPSDAINTKTTQTNAAGMHMTMLVYRNDDIAYTHTHENTKPSQVMSPSLPARPLTLHTAVEHDISVDRQGRDAGNLPFLPRSQIFPISPDAQKANLRRLSERHGISIKPDLDEEKPSIKTERSLSLQDSAPTSGNSISALQNDFSSQKLKVETPDDIDIPRLSMPPSPPSPDLSHTRGLPMLPEKPKPKPPSRRDFQNAPSLLAKVDHQDAQPHFFVAVSSGSRPAHALVPAVLPNPVIPLSQAPRHIAVSDFFDDADSRMGPDVAIPVDGWGQPSRPSPVEARPLEQRRQIGVRAPQNIDHYSPSPPPPPSRTPPPQRSRMPMLRRGDHYSPRRSPEPLPGYSRASPGPSHFRRSDSASNSRDVSPVNQGQGFARPRRNTRRSLTPELNAQLARKRPRDDQGPAGPPPRRPRYDKAPGPGRREMGHHTLAPPYQSSSYAEDWSHVATYARSPSPEPSRPVALSLRIDTNDVNQAQSGYRGGAGQRSDVAQRRQTNEYTPSPIQSQPVFGNHTYASNNQQRQNHREANNDSRPHLLSRFTDQGGLTAPPSEPAQHHPVPHHKAARGRPHKQPYPRANPHHQPLEQRINNNNKSALIDRIGQGPPGYE